MKVTSHLAYAARLWNDLGKELCVSITNDKGALNGSPESRRNADEACLLRPLGTWWLAFCFIKQIDGQCGLAVLRTW